MIPMCYSSHSMERCICFAFCVYQTPQIGLDSDSHCFKPEELRDSGTARKRGQVDISAQNIRPSMRERAEGQLDRSKQATPSHHLLDANAVPMMHFPLSRATVTRYAGRWADRNGVVGFSWYACLFTQVICNFQII